MPVSCSNRRGRCVAAVAGAMAVLLLAPVAVAQDAFTVQLLTPLSAASSRKGDQVRATVVSPAAFQGDTVQGQITEVKASRGQSVLQFTFVGLLHRGVSVPVASTVTSIANSQGQPGVDEQSRPIAASNPPPGESQARSRIGSRVGGMLGGQAGGVVSDASNAPSAPPVPNIRVAGQGPGIDLAAGATIGLSLHSTGRQSLDSLPPNAPASNPPEPAPASASALSMSAGATPVASVGGASASAPTGASGQPELKSVRIDFIPGEKTVFLDDFSDAAEDEPPPHWKVRGDPMELRVGGGIRQLTNIGHTSITSAPIDFPANFTFELDVKYQSPAKTWPSADWLLRTKDGRQAANLSTSAQTAEKVLLLGVNDSKDHLGGVEAPNVDFTQPVHLAVWSQSGRFRVYVNGNRVLDVNATTVPPPGEIVVDFNGGTGATEIGIRRVRVAESAPDFATVMAATGKYVTHGINFDTDSDRLKPDSAPVLKQVVAGLEKNPNLKLEIDGYTDSVGDAAHNLDLSKRRAEAVRSVLVSQFGVDAGRLNSNGFGAEQPIGSNDTPDGRAQNRRVEFVKQ